MSGSGWLRRFARRRLALAGLVVLILLAAFAFAGPVVEIGGHPFGVTPTGSDVLALVMRGTRRSLSVGFAAAVLGTGIGFVWGVAAGLSGGWIDVLLIRIIDVIVILPFVAVAAVLSGGSRGRLTWLHIAVVIGILAWTGTARVVRRSVHALRDKAFIEAAHAMGASSTRIVVRHILPNLGGVLALTATLTFATAVLTEAALSFVGLGGHGVSLGSVLRAAGTWPLWTSGGVLLLVCLSAHLVGDGLRDALVRR